MGITNGPTIQVPKEVAHGSACCAWIGNPEGFAGFHFAAADPVGGRRTSTRIRFSTTFEKPVIFILKGESFLVGESGLAGELRATLQGGEGAVVPSPLKVRMPVG